MALETWQSTVKRQQNLDIINNGSLQRRGIVMGKEKKALPGQLDYEDKVKLKKHIESEIKHIRDTVESIYDDNYESCILMAEENTQTKNTILRKVKYFKEKKNNLPEIIRKKKAELLEKRE